MRCNTKLTLALATAAIGVNSPAAAQFYKVDFAGYTENEGTAADGTSLNGSFLIDEANSERPLPFAFSNYYGSWSLQTSQTSINNTAVSAYAVTPKIDYHTFDYKSVVFAYSAHGYGDRHDAFDHSNPPSSLPFFDDTSAGLGVLQGYRNSYPGNGLPGGFVTNVSITTYNQPKVTTGVFQKYSAEVKSLSKTASEAMSTLSQVTSIASVVADGPTHYVKNVIIYLADQAVEYAARLVDNKEVTDASEYYKFAIGLAEAAKSNPYSAALGLISLTSSIGATNWDKIYRDPADFNYTELFVPNSSNDLTSIFASIPQESTYLKTLYDLNSLNGNLAGLLHSMERFQGADLANDENAKALQFAGFQFYNDASRQNAAAIADDFAILKLISDAQTGGTLSVGDDVEAAISSQCQTGFNSDVAGSLSSVGFTGGTGALDACTTEALTKHQNLNLGAAFDAAGTSMRAYSQGSLGAAVPEPSSWALMIIGFLMVGSALRKSTFTNHQRIGYVSS